MAKYLDQMNSRWMEVYNLFTGNLVTSHENAGTFDFVPPSSISFGHLEVDERPWIELGNSPHERITRDESIQAMASSWAGRRGSDILGIDF
jgi:hypothetical protein